MNKSLYYIECTFVKDSKFPHVNYKKGEIVYYNPKSASNETYVFEWNNSVEEKVLNHARQYNIFSSNSHIPFTRQKKNAKKWQISSYPENIVRSLEHIGDVKCTIKEIKITYTEEEV